jgi:hypothetical protein
VELQGVTANARARSILVEGGCCVRGRSRLTQNGRCWAYGRGCSRRLLNAESRRLISRRAGLPGVREGRGWDWDGSSLAQRAPVFGVDVASDGSDIGARRFHICDKSAPLVWYSLSRGNPLRLLRLRSCSPDRPPGRHPRSLAMALPSRGSTYCAAG